MAIQTMFIFYFMISAPYFLIFFMHSIIQMLKTTSSFKQVCANKHTMLHGV